VERGLGRGNIASLGIWSSTEATHSLLLAVLPKVSEGVLLSAPILVEEMHNKGNIPHPCLPAAREIGCAFFVTFFAQAKKVNDILR